MIPADDRPLPQLLRPLLEAGRLGSPAHWLEGTASTQDLALRAAQQGAAEGELFLADSQSRGRGRHGHAWSSPPGVGLYASLILRPGAAGAALLPLTLAAGLAIAEAVTEVAAVGAELRWPNDLLLGGKKFCGLLLEVTGEAAVLGLGLNVHAVEFPPELAPLATFLDAHASPPVSRLRLCAAALRHLERRYRQWQSGNAAAILRDFEARSPYARGMEVTVGGAGDAPYRGRTDGLEPEGFLRVRLPGGEVRVVVTGDVRPAER